MSLLGMVTGLVHRDKLDDYWKTLQCLEQQVSLGHTAFFLQLLGITACSECFYFHHCHRILRRMTPAVQCR